MSFCCSYGGNLRPGLKGLGVLFGAARRLSGRGAITLFSMDGRVGYVQQHVRGRLDGAISSS